MRFFILFLIQLHSAAFAVFSPVFVKHSFASVLKNLVFFFKNASIPFELVYLAAQAFIARNILLVKYCKWPFLNPT